MPTYQYSCTECGHFFEQVQSFTDESLTVCPECQGRLRKVFNAVGVVFKGSGFYRTDSRSDGAGASKVAKESGTKESGTKDTGTSGSSGSTPKSTSSSTSPGSSSGSASGSSATGASVG